MKSKKLAINALLYLVIVHRMSPTVMMLVDAMKTAASSLRCETTQAMLLIPGSSNVAKSEKKDDLYD